MAYSPTYTRDRRGKWPAEQNTGITQVVAGSDAYIMEDEFNLMQQMLNEARADIVRKAVNSGFVSMGTDSQYYTSGVQAGFKNLPNLFLLAGGSTGVPIYINGYQLKLWGTGDGFSFAVPISLDPPPVANTVPSSPGSARDDLAFIEAWFQEVSSSSGSADTSLYNYGGVTSGTVANDILDTRVNAETTRRVQLRWRLRTVSGVDFSKYREGLGSPDSTAWDGGGSAQIYPQAGNSAPLTSHVGGYGVSYIGNGIRAVITSEPGYKVAIGDTGLYTAGFGDATSQSLLKSVDGYVYAIPLFRVRRRNNTGFDPDTNPLGARDYVSTTTAAGTNVPSTPAGTPYNLTVNNASGILAGDTVFNANNTWLLKVNSVTGNTLNVTYLGGPGGQNISHGGGELVFLKSDRPDSLYSNIIDASDITDLRHQVSLTGFNMQALLEKNLDLLLRGQLTTNAPARYGRDYIGLSTSAYTDDVNTLLYAKYDNSINGTANSAAVTGTAVGGSATFVNGVQGQALAPSTVVYASYPVSIASGVNTYAIELMWKGSWNDGNSRGFVSLVDGSGNAVASLYKYTDNKLYLTMGAGILGVSAPVPNNFPNDITWHKILVSVNAGVVSLIVDGVALASSGSISALPATVTNANVGFARYGGTYANGAIDLVRISNIARSETLIPANFRAYEDRILDGPNADFTTWSDDVGGTAGLSGRTNPYGLSRVPNQLAGRVAYNGSEVRHYYGQGFTPGWATSAYGGASSPTPTGSFDSNAEVIYISSNEAANGSITTFTFTKPTNTQGVSLLFNAPTVSVYVNGVYTAASSMVYNPSTGLITVVFPSAPANSSVIQLYYDMGSRHAHFIPSTKGFVLHDWTDDSIAANGSATLFQTTKYNVTNINHVRTAPTATPNTQTIAASGTTYQGIGCATTLTGAHASGVTTLNVGSTTNMFVGQSLRIAKGDGTWYSTTVSTIVNATSITVPVTTVALTSGATIQGTAQVTFGVAPAAGTVDIVYESVLTPSLGDYLRVMYQATPYQGTANFNNLLITYLNKNGAFITSRGTGLYAASDGSWIEDYPVTSTLLPINGKDYQLKNDTLAIAGNTIAGSKANLITNEQAYASVSSGGVPAGNFAQGGTVGMRVNSPAERGFTTAYLTGTNGAIKYIQLAFRSLASAVGHMVVLAFIVQDAVTNELFLVVATEVLTSAANEIRIVGPGAIDTFRLQGRPLIKGYAGVTN